MLHVRLVSQQQDRLAPHLLVVQHALQDAGALGQSAGVRAVHHEDEAVHLVVVLGPDPSETPTAAQVVDGDVIALGVDIDLFTASN